MEEEPNKYYVILVYSVVLRQNNEFVEYPFHTRENLQLIRKQ